MSSAAQPPVLHLASGRVHPGTAVVAVNAWTASVLDLPLRLYPALTLALATVPLDDATLVAVGLAERIPFYTVDLPYLWGRVLGDGRLVVGAGLVFPTDGDVGTVRLDTGDGRSQMERLEARVRGLHPALASVGVAARWGGPIAFAESRTPILTRLADAPAVVVTGGCAGHGVALAARLGELIAGAVLEGRPLPAWGALP